MKYTLYINKNTKERSVRINKTGEVVLEKENPERYMELRKKALVNYSRVSKDDALRSLGLKKVRGNLGGTYWE